MPDDVEWCRVSCAIYNTKMLNEVSIIDHVLYMIEIIERLGKLGCLLHEQFDKDATLNSLSSSYFYPLTPPLLREPTPSFCPPPVSMAKNYIIFK